MKKITLFILLVFGINFSIMSQTFTNLVSYPATDGSISFYHLNGVGYQMTKQSIQGGGQILNFRYITGFTQSNIMSFNNSSLIVGNPVTTSEKFYVNGNSTFAGVVKINPEFTSGSLFQIGTNGGLYNFTLGTSGTINSIIGNNRSQFFASSSTTYLGLRDNNNTEIFKVSNDPTLGSFLHLPKLNSRIVIGEYGNYRLNEGKLVIKQGNALIEGNILAEGNIHSEGDIYVDGKIGIGTANPDEKLTVKGKIHAEEVKVDLSVPPDYVFEKFYTGESTLKSDYQMLTLQEIEDFTKLNYHLPNVPSAEEIQKDGLKLSEMTSILLQKIEELTLYTIEQEKRIKALESKQ
ncbi:MAG: polymer-forming cytoskeletal protein [Aequorivita antarctica]